MDKNQRLISTCSLNRCGSVLGKHQGDPWFPAEAIHQCGNHRQTWQLHPSHSLQTTGITPITLNCPLAQCYSCLCWMNLNTMCCAPVRWSSSWSCALWTSLTVCCWRASPLWSSYSKAYPVTLETYFLRSVHSDLRCQCTGTYMYTASLLNSWV